MRGKQVILLTTSNRYAPHGETPKSTQLAYQVQAELGSDCKLIDVPKLKIHHCEGNVSSVAGNNCGVKEALLKNKGKNPTGLIRCWASVNNEDDELYKVANAIFEADAVIFFISMRWGQANAYYQKLIERLDWISRPKIPRDQNKLPVNWPAASLQATIGAPKRSCTPKCRFTGFMDLKCLQSAHFTTNGPRMIMKRA